MLKKSFKLLLLSLFVLACESNNDISDLENTFDNSKSNLESKESKSKAVTPASWYGVHINAFTSPNKYLSTNKSGTLVDLYPIDDKSGRQKWDIVYQGTSDPSKDYYHIKISGGVGTARKYLSTTFNGGKVDLYHYDDGSGRQRWLVSAPSLGQARTIKVVGGVIQNKRYLEQHSNGGNVWVEPYKNPSSNNYKQNWVIGSFN